MSKGEIIIREFEDGKFAVFRDGVILRRDCVDWAIFSSPNCEHLRFKSRRDAEEQLERMLRKESVVAEYVYTVRELRSREVTVDVPLEAQKELPEPKSEPVGFWSNLKRMISTGSE
jgi:hypothetical protein